jgi:hypothetical protein
MADTDDDGAMRRLWSSTIIQALIDATSEPKTPSATVCRDQAKAWLTAEFGTTAQNFEEVCYYANIEPTRVRSFFKTYEGPPLNMHILSRMRDSLLIVTTAR